MSPILYFHHKISSIHIITNMKIEDITINHKESGTKLNICMLGKCGFLAAIIFFCYRHKSNHCFPLQKYFVIIYTHIKVERYNGMRALPRHQMHAL
jgi:hypothetical protein